MWAVFKWFQRLLVNHEGIWLSVTKAGSMGFLVIGGVPGFQIIVFTQHLGDGAKYYFNINFIMYYSHF